MVAAVVLGPVNDVEVPFGELGCGYANGARTPPAPRIQAQPLSEPRHRRRRAHLIRHEPQPRQRAQQTLEAISQLVPLGRVAHPDEIAKIFAFVASEDASFMHGAEVFVDGGKAQV